MTVTTGLQVRYLPTEFRLTTARYRNVHKSSRPSPPIYISTNAADVNADRLRELYSLCNYSCHRFPSIDSCGKVEPVQINKLRVALAHSSIVVSVFSSTDVVSFYSSSNPAGTSSDIIGLGGDWFRRVIPVTPSTGELVGFGRAVTDCGLTGSIHDIMVIPSLRRMGIGKMIVKKLLRILTNRGIYDISALCSYEERLFFKACGFGGDILGSTTMMYGRMVSTCLGEGNNQMVTRAATANLPLMGKIWIEVCLISARGLRRPSLLKLQRYAVGWIDPSKKYCTGIVASGTANPVWKTKFSALVDANSQDLAVHVQVYCREPIFLTESLLGTATVVLKEFLDKYMKNTDISEPVEEVGSFQLRKHNSDKPCGFIDVSIRVSEGEEHSTLTGNEGEIELSDGHGTINLLNQYLPDPAGFHQRENHGTNTNIYSHPQQFPINYGHPTYPPAGAVSYMPPPPPPPPPRAPAQPPPAIPSGAGYIPRTIPPRVDKVGSSYTNLPPSGAGMMQGGALGVGMGLGAGMLAASAGIFRNDFMSGLDVPDGIVDCSGSASISPQF